MRFCLIVCLAGAAVAGAALAKPAEGPSRTFSAMDLFGLQAAGDPQIRPDGRQIAYVRSTSDIMTDKARSSIWLVDPDTDEETPLAAAGAGSAMEPRWSPDGKRLAYVAEDGQGGQPQLYVRWMATGATAKITDLPQAPDALSWSPDGRAIAFTMFTPDDGQTFGAPLKAPEGAKWADPLKVIDRLHYREDGQGYFKPGFTHIFMVSADGGSPRQLTFGAYDDNGPVSFTPDGRFILFSANRGKDPDRDPGNSEVFQLAIADGTLTALTHRYGPDAQPVVSPDGKSIAYLGFDDTRTRGYENVRLSVMDRDGGRSRSLTDGLDRAVDDAKWSPDGRSLVIQYADHGVTRLARVTLDGHIQPLAEGLAGEELDRPYSGGSFTVGAGGALAFTLGAPDHPADIGFTRGGPARRLTRLNDGLFQGKTLARVEALPVTSALDKLPIDAWIVTPPNFDPAGKYPLILEIHGGPFASYGPTFSTDDQLYAAAGYVVVYANPRGSTSYGDAFANQIDKAYPGHDYDDLMSVVDAAVAKGFVDPGQLFVTGGSGGGVLSAWIIGKTDRFRAAAVQKPVIDWASFSLTTDEYADLVQHWFGKPPWEDPDAYWKRSPLSLMGNVKTPAMVIVGEEDYRTPDSESEQYYQALQLKGVPSALIKVPGASHGGLAGRPSQSAAKAAAILAWFGRYRTGAAH